MQRWEELSQKPEYSVLHSAIKSGIQTTEKYFGKATRSSAQIMNLCTCLCHCILKLLNKVLVLNPAAKQDYFTLYWSEDGCKHADEVITKVVCSFCLMYHNISTYDHVQFDRYKAELEVEDGRPKATSHFPLRVTASESVCDIEYGKDRLQAVIQLRRQQEKNVPKDTHEELSHYKADFVQEGVKDLLNWWKVCTFGVLLCFTYKFLGQ